MSVLKDVGSEGRAHARRIFRRPSWSLPGALGKILGCSGAAVAVGYWARVSGQDLSIEGVRMLQILVVAAGLWMTEAIPAFAVGLLAMALQILVATPVGNSELMTWQEVLAPWASPLIWLFFGGFVLSLAATKVGLDLAVASSVLRWFGRGPRLLLAGVMAVSFVLSMLISNTATAAMLVGVVTPLMISLPARYASGLLLGIALSASLGGMGTLIGSPPNAIAVSALAGKFEISFLQWMAYGLVPAIVLVAAMGVLVWFRHGRTADAEVDMAKLRSGLPKPPVNVAKRDRFFVATVIVLVVLMWLTERCHGMSPALVAFMGVTLLTVTGTVTAQELRNVPWEVLLLMAGGLSLGQGVQISGLADWLGSLFPAHWSRAGLALGLAIGGVLLSNFMSNTAAASILVPLAISLSPDRPELVALPVALACSCATLLPVSTPPNAIAFASGRLRTADFVWPGLTLIVLGPLVLWLWLGVVL